MRCLQMPLDADVVEFFVSKRLIASTLRSSLSPIYFSLSFSLALSLSHTLSLSLCMARVLFVLKER